jgi:hypothetical protein
MVWLCNFYAECPLVNNASKSRLLTHGVNSSGGGFQKHSENQPLNIQSERPKKRGINTPDHRINEELQASF